MANKITSSEKLVRTARAFESPLFLVGGYVRNSLLAIPASDRDVCSALTAERAQELFAEQGYLVKSVYPRLGTVKLFDKETGEELEYTRFRTESYAEGGGHTPAEVVFSEDIEADARRRDFRMNAIYYDIAADRVVDPLGGLADLEARQIHCADDPMRVFGSDGLRLLRLVRFSAELGFEPSEETFSAALACRDNLDDIVPERIADEFFKICHADTRYPGHSELADPAHVRGLLLADSLGLLEKILPEIIAGKGMAQREDFHKFDVFRHTVEAFRLSPPEIRIAALLHDVGKPVCFRETGNFHGHELAGAPLAHSIARRAFGLSKKEAGIVEDLVRWHMYDMACKTRENKLKKFLVRHFAIVPALLELKQADYLACGLRTGECPTAARWRELLAEMERLQTPTSLRMLKITGRDVSETLPDLPKPEIKRVLDTLWDACVCDESRNDREWLLEYLHRLGEKGTETR